MIKVWNLGECEISMWLKLIRHEILTIWKSLGSVYMVPVGIRTVVWSKKADKNESWRAKWYKLIIICVPTWSEVYICTNIQWNQWYRVLGCLHHANILLWNAQHLCWISTRIYAGSVPNEIRDKFCVTVSKAIIDIYFKIKDVLT